jgi:hypothetical protein
MRVANPVELALIQDLSEQSVVATALCPLFAVGAKYALDPAADLVFGVLTGSEPPERRCWSELLEHRLLSLFDCLFFEYLFVVDIRSGFLLHIETK